MTQPIPQPTPQPPPQSTVGPAVVSVEWLGNHSTSTTIVLQFNQSLDAGPAQTKSNYTILTMGLHGQFGKGSKHIALKSAIYNAASHTVTLRASRPLKVGQRYQLTLAGTVAGRAGQHGRNDARRGLAVAAKAETTSPPWTGTISC